MTRHRGDIEGDLAHGHAAQSVFTRYLVEGLRDGSADLDGDGDITLDELYSYVHDRVVEEMPQQRPKRQDNVEGRTIIASDINWTLPGYLRNRTVRAEDGATVDVHLHRQPAAPSAPVLVCMPATGTRAAYCTPLAEALSEAGFQVVVGELRGQGTSSVKARRGVRYGYHEMVTYDYPALFAMVATEFPSARRHLLGHSLGGQLGMLHLSQDPGSAAGAILVGAPSCHYRGWPLPRGLGMLVGLHLAIAIGWSYGSFPGRRLGVLGDDSTQVVRDLATQTRTGRYQVPSSDTDFEPLLAKMDLPVLAVTVEGDGMAPSAAVRNLTDKLANAQVTHWDLVLDGTHRNPHYGWIQENASLVERVRMFIAG